MVASKNSERNRRIGLQIRIARKSRGLSLNGLGQELGISYQQVLKYEQAQNRVSVVRLMQIAEVLNYPVGFFINDNELMEVDSNLGSYATQLGRVSDEKLKKAIIQLIDAASA